MNCPPDRLVIWRSTSGPAPACERAVAIRSGSVFRGKFREALDAESADWDRY